MTGSLQVKNGKYWTAIYLGKNHQPPYDWKPTGLPMKGNKKAALKILNERVAEWEVRRGLNEAEMTFADFMLEWLEGMQTKVRPNTYHQYELIVKNSIVPFFEKSKVLLKDLQPMHIQRYYNQRKKDGVSANTIKHYHANIHKALKYAVQLNMIPSNPSERLELDPVEEYVGNFYTADQLKTILELVKCTPIETPVLMTVTYGLRLSEAIGVQWSAIDFKNQTVTIKHTVTGSGKNLLREDRTKNKSSRRTLYLPEPLLAHLQAVKASQWEMMALLGKGYSKSDYVCTREDGRLLKPNYVSRKLKAILSKYSQDNTFPVYRYHDLRHSAASLLAADGKSLKQIGELLGHSNPATTNRYAHLQHQATVDMVQSIADKIFA